jgi:hypothetical protein
MGNSVEQCCCAALNMLTVEGFINKLGEDVHRLWKCLGEQFKKENSASERHLLLLQLNSSPCTLRV